MFVKWTESLIIVLAILLIAPFTIQADEGTRLLRFPDIHQDKIVFSYAGDLWTVSDQGGTAARLTSHASGLEQYPKFSADGSLIAFSGEYDGNTDVYLIPTEGGLPKRLTYHSASDRVYGWTPDGKVFFQSHRDQITRRIARLYSVGTEGGMPQPLPMNTGAAASFSPDGTLIAYNRIDRNHRTWKRYQGGMAQDIWVYNTKTNKTIRVTNYKGTDAFPMWSGDLIYFVSDRNHTANIFVYGMSTGTIRQVTNHDQYDVKWPSLGSGKIVYENGGFIYVLDLKTEKTRKLNIQVPSDRLAARPKWVRLDKQINYGSISPKGKRAALGARGEILTVPAEKGDVRNLTGTSGVREREPNWSPDGKWIAYFSDRTGEMEIFVISQDGRGLERQVTSGGKVYRRGLRWSPDSKKLLFADKDQSLYWVEVDSGAITKIVKAEYNDITDYAWSPDSKWIAYIQKGSNRLGSLYLHSLDLNSSYPVTGPTTDDLDPVFDPGGKYLFFLSNRDIKPYMDMFDAEYILSEITRVYAVTLAKDTPSIMAPESDEAGESEEVVDEQDDKDKKKKGKKEEGPKPIKVDIDGIGDRIVALPIPSANYRYLLANEQNLFFMSIPKQPLGGTWDKQDRNFSLLRYSIEDREVETVIGGIWGYDLSADGKKILYAGDQVIGIVDSTVKDQTAGEGKIDPTGLTMHLDFAQEWEQIFNEAWRMQRDFFYDPELHGLDWPAMKQRYGQLLPHVAHREDLNYLLGEMIGELNVSHTYVWGGDSEFADQVNVGLLGADFELDQAANRYRIARILPPDEWNLDQDAPLAQPGLDVREGDYLLAVNGQELSGSDNPYRLFQNTADRQVLLKLASRSDGRDAREVTVKPVSADIGLRYRQWVKTNRRKVDQATDGKIGYLHIPNMSSDGLKEFSKGFMAVTGKQGLIVDIRYNGGGFVSEIILEKLRRELVGMFSARNSRDESYPWMVIHGPMVCLTNEYAGSDGDIFPYYFRKYKLGKIVGRRTWGGVVGIRLDKHLIDGGLLTMPEYGTYSLDRKWIIENRGVEPDIEVDLLTEDVLAGRDPQLDKAIAVALEELKSNSGVFPVEPDHFPRPDEKKYE